MSAFTRFSVLSLVNRDECFRLACVLCLVAGPWLVEAAGQDSFGSSQTVAAEARGESVEERQQSETASQVQAAPESQAKPRAEDDGETLQSDAQEGDTQQGDTVQQNDEPASSPAGSEKVQVPQTFPVDVTEFVEVTTHGVLHRTRDQKWAITVSIRNVSPEDVPGPLLLIVEDVGIDGLTAVPGDGQLISGEKYLQLLPEGRTLRAGRRTGRRRFEFSLTRSSDVQDAGAQQIPAAQIQEFDPEWQVRRDKPEPVGRRVLHPRDQQFLDQKSYTMADLQRVMAAQNLFSSQALANPEVYGTATAESADGELVIMVFASRAGVSRDLPKSVGGVPVEIEPTGIITAGPVGPRPGEDQVAANLMPEADPFAETGVEAFNSNQTGPRQRIRPLGIGSSTSNIEDFCLSGTLGFRATDGRGKTVIVSNWHVWSRDGLAVAGEGILQPSRGDNGCRRRVADVIGKFREFEPIRFESGGRRPNNRMDAAVAEMDPDMVLACTPGNGYGFPATNPATPLIGMKVQKYGRTTQQTRGIIRAVNVRVRVNYGAGKIATFRNQLAIQADTGVDRFSAGGDSGSLIVTAGGRRPVGLLFAGGGSWTFGNHISDVLERFDLRVDGETSTPPPSDPNTGKIGDLVWLDANRNGTKDSDEQGIPGVKIWLFAAGPNGQIGGGDDKLIGEQVTDSTGRYVFDQLSADRYFLLVFAPEGQQFTTQNAGTSDDDDSDINPDDSRSEVFNLSAGQVDLSRDAGLFTVAPSGGTAAVGNRVFLDSRRNGRQTRRTSGVDRIRVELFSVGPDGQPQTADDVSMGTRTTIRGGFYKFDNLAAGFYFLRFESGPNFRFTQPDVGNDRRDSDAGPDGTTNVFQLFDNQYNNTLDAGLVPR